MSIVVRVYCEDKIYNINMTGCDTATIGTGSSDTLRIGDSNMKKSHITITKKRGDYIIKGKDIYNRFNDSLSSDVLTVGNTYIVNVMPQMNISIHPVQEGSSTIDLTHQTEVLVGREIDNNIIFANGRTSSKHFKIYRESGILKIRDLRSSNGTYVNGRKITEKILSDGDVINFAIYEAVIKGNMLTIFNIGRDMQLNLKKVEASSLVHDDPEYVDVKPEYKDYDVNKSGHESGGYIGGVSTFDGGSSHHEGTMSMFDSRATYEPPVNSTYDGGSSHHEGTMSMFDSRATYDPPVTPSYESTPPVKDGTMSMFDSKPSYEPPAPAYSAPPVSPTYDGGYSPKEGTMSMFETSPSYVPPSGSVPGAGNMDDKMKQRLAYVNHVEEPTASLGDEAKRSMTADGLVPPSAPVVNPVPNPAGVGGAPVNNMLKYVDVPEEKTTELHSATASNPAAANPTMSMPAYESQSAPVIESGSSYNAPSGEIPAWELPHGVANVPLTPGTVPPAPGTVPPVPGNVPPAPGNVPPAPGLGNPPPAPPAQGDGYVDYANYACSQYQSVAREMPEQLNHLTMDSYRPNGK